MQADRRRTIRAPCHIAVEFGRWPRRVRAVVKDLNRDGVFILTTAAAPLNTVLQLTMMLPSGPITFLAVVRFRGRARHGVGIGAAILAIEPEDRARWDACYERALDEMLDRFPVQVAKMLRVERRG